MEEPIASPIDQSQVPHSVSVTPEVSIVTGTPADSTPQPVSSSVPPIVSTGMGLVPPKPWYKRVGIVIGVIIGSMIGIIIIAFLIIILLGVIEGGKKALQSKSVTTSATENTKTPATAVYNNQTYTLGYTDKKDMDFYEFNLPGESGNSWTKLITMVSYKKDGVSLVEINKDTAMQMASNIIASTEKKGVVLEKNKYIQGEAAEGSPETYIIIYALNDAENKRVEINMQKYFVEETTAKMVGYGMRLPFITGESKEALGKRVQTISDELFATEKNFVATKYQFPE